MVALTRTTSTATGGIPTELAAMEALWVLDLSGNQLTGESIGSEMARE